MTFYGTALGDPSEGRSSCGNHARRTSAMNAQSGRRIAGPRCIALVGPYLSGKTTLLEAILFRTGAVERQGKVADGSTVGDNSPEARSHRMSVELNVASASFLGDTYTFV